MDFDFKKMHKMITDAHTVAITSHFRPDGDSVGSAIAMRLAIKGMGKKVVDIFVDDNIPEKLSYMADVKNISRPSENAVTHYDLFIILDASSEDRIGRCTDLRSNADKILVVDHHKENRVKADEKIVSEKAASTGEILYAYFAEFKIKITKEIAEALYTSIATDSGCFMHASTSSNTHAIVSELIKTGVNHKLINYVNFKVYERSTIGALAYVYKHIKFFANGKIASVFLPHRIIKKYNLRGGDTDRLKNIVSEASGVYVGAFIPEETKGEFHVSLRSHDKIDVASVAIHFSGGGHKNASGFTFNGKYRTLEKKLVKYLEKIV